MFSVPAVYMGWTRYVRYVTRGFAMRNSRTAGFYTATNMLSFAASFLFVRETKQLTLEELDQVFEVPMTTFVTYNVTKVVPWWFKRYLFWQKTAQLEPLFHADREMEQTDY